METDVSVIRVLMWQIWVRDTFRKRIVDGVGEKRWGGLGKSHLGCLEMHGADIMECWR